MAPPLTKSEKNGTILRHMLKTYAEGYCRYFQISLPFIENPKTGGGVLQTIANNFSKSIDRHY